MWSGCVPWSTRSAGGPRCVGLEVVESILQTARRFFHHAGARGCGWCRVCATSVSLCWLPAVLAGLLTPGFLLKGLEYRVREGQGGHATVHKEAPVCDVVQTKGTLAAVYCAQRERLW